jgi:hypothetical protein
LGITFRDLHVGHQAQHGRDPYARRGDPAAGD